MIERPFVSFIVVAYNQERFIHDALQSAIAQTYDPLEIILSDDCSTDRTFEIIRDEVRAYCGPHLITINRNDKNLGLAGNINRAFELASGQFFVLQGGDDISLPHRTAELVRRWLNGDRPVDLVCSYFEEIDVDGKPTGFIKKNVTFVPDTTQDVLQWACGATGACAAYSRRLYDKYGPLDKHVISEDWVYSFRAWVESGIGLVEQPLVLHRTHAGSLSVVHRTVNAEQDRAVRRSLRQRMAENQLAIAKEWLHAWKLSGSPRDSHIKTELARLVRLRELQLSAYELGPLGALKAAALSFLNGAGFLSALRLIVRNGLGWQ
jgi:glycosyltransferase involved in cell wall biosynthesis